MKSTFVIGVALFGLSCCTALGKQAESNAVNPLENIVVLLKNLREKIRAEGETDRKTYRKFKNWCDESENNAHFAVVTLTKKDEKLKASNLKLNSDIQTATSKIEQLTADLSANEKELRNMEKVRAKEHEDFTRGEKELMDMATVLDKAMEVLESKGTAALAQVNTAKVGNVVHALGVVLDAASVRTSDRSKLLALVQSMHKTSEDADDEADDTAAPAGKVYESKSGSIVDILGEMQSTSTDQLKALRRSETDAQHNFDLLKNTMNAQKTQDTRDLKQQHEAQAKAMESLAVVEGDQTGVTKDLHEAEKEHQVVQQTCLETASEQEQANQSRDQELKALWTAIDILRKASQSASSFVQLASSATMSFSRSRVVGEVQRLAKEEHSTALAQLASRIASAMRHGTASGQDPFGKVKNLLKDMIKKTEKEAADAATKKAECDKELEKTGLKEEDLKHDVHVLRAKLDTDQSKLTSLKKDIKTVDRELADIAKEQSELLEMSTEQQEEYTAEMEELTKALSGVKEALKTLKDYYDNSDDAQDDSKFAALMQQPAPPQKHQPASGAGNTIIAMLEGIKEDLEEQEAKLDKAEESRKASYSSLTAENDVAVASFTENEEFSRSQKKDVSTEITEFKEEKSTSTEELNAVDEYLIKLKHQCQPKADAYQERQRRKQSRVDGLTRALEILEDEAQGPAAPAFLQRLRSHRGLRGNLALNVAAMQ